VRKENLNDTIFSRRNKINSFIKPLKLMRSNLIISFEPTLSRLA